MITSKTHLNGPCVQQVTIGQTREPELAAKNLHVPDKCFKCRHFARFCKGFKGGWCLMVNDGYTNDCLLTEIDKEVVV